MFYVTLAALIALAGATLVFAPALMPWALGLGLGMLLLGLFHRVAEQVLGTLLSPAEDLRALPGRLEMPRARLAAVAQGLRSEQGLDRAALLMQRVLGAFLHVGFALVALAAEASLFFPVWQILYDLELQPLSFLGGVTPAALAPWAFVLALSVFLSVVTDLRGWTHFGPWSTDEPAGKRLAGVLAAVGAGLTFVLLMAASGLRSEGFVLSESAAIPAASVSATLTAAPPADLSLLAPQPELMKAPGADPGLAAFEQRRATAVKVVSFTSVGVLMVAGFFAATSLADLVVMAALLVLALGRLLLWTGQLALGFVAWAVYWVARLVQAVFILLSRVAVMLARPVAAALNLRETDLDADLSDRPRSSGYEGAEGHEAAAAAAPAGAAPAAPRDEDPDEGPDPESEEAPSRNWRPFR